MRPEELRQRLIEYVLKRSGGQFAFAEMLEELRPAPKVDLPEIEKAALQALLHDLYVRGLIMPAHYDTFGGFGPTWEVTERGRASLQANDLLDVDPVGFVKRSRQSASELPAACWEYLGDSVACLDRHLTRPAAVMLGVAAELAGLELAGQVMRTCAPARVDKWLAERKGFAARWSDALAMAKHSQLWPRIRNGIEANDDAAGLLRSDVDRVEDQIDTLLTMIRLYRNDAGHANPVTVSEDIVRAFLVVFPDLAASISRVVGLVAGASAAEPESGPLPASTLFRGSKQPGSANAQRAR